MCLLLLLRSPSFQYCSVCISISLETVLWKAKISSSAVNKVRRSAASCREEPKDGSEADKQELILNLIKDNSENNNKKEQEQNAVYLILRASGLRRSVVTYVLVCLFF